MTTKAVGIGAGGHASVMIEIVHEAGGVSIVGLVDSLESLWGSDVLGVPVLGGDSLLPTLRKDGVSHAFLGIGSIADTRPRQRLYELAKAQGFEMLNVIHRAAVISPTAVLGAGPAVTAGVIINARARLGANVIVNTGAIVEHDCRIGDHVHVSTGARLAGGVIVGDGTHIGIGAIVKQRVRIGSHAVVGAGAVVIDDVPDEVVVAGVPARFVRDCRREAQ